MNKRYLQCPALVTIALLKKFLRLKYDLDATHAVSTRCHLFLTLLCARQQSSEVDRRGGRKLNATPYPENISLLTCSMQEWIPSAESLITAILWRKVFLLPDRIKSVCYTPIVAHSNCHLSRPRFLLSRVLPVSLPTHLLSCCETCCSPEFDDDRLNRLSIVLFALWSCFAATTVAIVAAACQIILLSFFVTVLCYVYNDISRLALLCYSVLPFWRHRSYLEAKDCDKESTRCNRKLLLLTCTDTQHLRWA